MSDFFWVANGGHYSDSSHWSATSGGAGGFGVPTVTDNVFFDVNSFSSSGQVVLIDDTDHNLCFCASIDWTGALHNPIFRFSGVLGNTLLLNGSMTLITGMSVDNTSTKKRVNQFVFQATTNIFLDTKGINLPVTVAIDNITLAPLNVDINSDLQTILCIMGQTGSTFDFVVTTFDHTVTSGAMDISTGSLAITFQPGASIINIVGFIDGDGTVLNGFNFENTNSSYVDGGSIIKLNYPVNASNGLLDLGLYGQSIGEVQCLGSSSISNPYFFVDFTSGTPGSTINTLTLQPDNVIKFFQTSTFIINSFFANGSSGHNITFRSSSTGNQYTISAINLLLSFIDVEDCIAAGSTPFDDTSGVDSGNNVNWIFSTPVVSIFLPSPNPPTISGIISVLNCMGQQTGVVYGPSPNPTIADSSVTVSSIVGPFTVDIPTLVIRGSTTYLRPYVLCGGVYTYYNQIVYTSPSVNPITLATDNLIGAYQIEILDGSNNIIVNLTGYAFNFSFTITRNRPEEILFSIPLLTLQQLASTLFTDIQTILATGINTVRIKRKNVILIAGQLDYWEALFDDPTKPVINVKAHGWLSLLSYRTFSGEYTSKDQNFILQDILSQTQALTHGNFGITVGTSAVGTNSYTDIIFENKTISDIFIQFADESNGIGFSFTWDKVVNFYFPDAGTQHQDILFTYPGNTLSIDISSDSTRIVNSLLGRGQGNANANIETIINDATSQTTYKLRTAVKDYPDVNSADQLVNVTGSEVQFYKNPLILHTLSYAGADPSTPSVGTYAVGDQVRVAISLLPLYSDLLNDFFTIDKQTVAVNDQGFEAVTLELNNAP